MRYRSSIGPAGRLGRQGTADDTPRGAKTPSPAPGGASDMMSMDGIQVVRRKCTICDWEAQLVEKGMGEDPLCPWCYGPTERASVIGLVVPEHLRPGQKNPYAASLGRLGGLKGGPARAEKLSAKRRREIAAKAARARWRNKKR
jgi:hypothetical protein